MSKIISVIDYKAGNAPSVLNALEHLNIPAKIVTTAEAVLGADALILPGVGAAEETMRALGGTGVKEALIQRVYKGNTPFLGICVGLQILFEKSEEDSAVCLGWLNGEVRRFGGGQVRVPQIGWNEVRFLENGGVRDSLFEGLGSSDYFYFVNSYYAVPEESAIVVGETDYSVTFPAAIRSKARMNICAAQFHLEKSGKAGHTVLYNFAKEAGAVC